MTTSHESKNAEYLSALFDGESSQTEKLSLSAEHKQTLKNYSLIGAALRNELPRKVDMSFSDSVMNTIAKEKIVPELKIIPVPTYKFVFRKVAAAVAQMAMVASVAAVTVIGYQTFTADSSVIQESASNALGPVDGVNLASYQTSSQASNKINLSTDEDKAENAVKLNSSELKKQQALEVERINNYIRGYVVSTASN